jgi:hypothetical protein
MNKPDNTKKFKKIIKDLNTYKVLFIASVIFVVAFVFLINGFLKDFAGHFLIISAVLMIFELFMRRQFKDEMAVTVAEAINADVTFLKEKMEGKVDSIIKNCLEAKLRNKAMAINFFDGLISPAISLENHRKTFDYKISLEKLNEDVCVDNATFGKDSYFRMTEDLTFTKRLILKKEMELVVGVCFADEQLKHYKGKECIYRSVLKFKDSEKEVIKTIVDNNHFPETILKITINIGSVELTLQDISTYDVMKGIRFAYKYEGTEIKADKETKVEIKVTTFHEKEANYYTAYLFEPTFKPTIQLKYNDEMKEPFCISYFMCNEGEQKEPEEPRDNFISVSTKIKEWVFPTSGVVFMWTPK